TWEAVAWRTTTPRSPPRTRRPPIRSTPGPWASSWSRSRWRPRPRAAGPSTSSTTPATGSSSPSGIFTTNPSVTAGRPPSPPEWVNHLAFAAADLDDLEARKLRLLDGGNDVVEIDHGWCSSIYANDPNGIVIEFCTTTRALTEADRQEAQRLLADPQPPVMS